MNMLELLFTLYIYECAFWYIYIISYWCCVTRYVYGFIFVIIIIITIIIRYMLPTCLREFVDERVKFFPEGLDTIKY